jgi:hypothetical protein
VDGHVYLAEFELRDPAESLIEGKASETERGTCDVHGGLRALRKSGRRSGYHFGGLLIPVWRVESKSSKLDVQNLGILIWLCDLAGTQSYALEPSMPPPFSSQPAGLWIEVLDNVEETLRKTEAAAAERELVLNAASVASNAEKPGRSDVQQSLQRLEEQMSNWPAALQQAEKEAREADAALQAAEETLRRWLDCAETLERRLANWGNYGV